MHAIHCNGMLAKIIIITSLTKAHFFGEQKRFVFSHPDTEIVSVRAEIDQCWKCEIGRVHLPFSSLIRSMTHK